MEKTIKKSGVELIAEERQEQINKHGRTVLKDVAYNQALNSTQP